MTSYDDYRSFLKDHIEDRARATPGFSLRSFARLSGLSASHLSRTLSGQKKLSPTSAHQISAALRHTPSEKSHFLALVELERARTEVQRQELLRALTRRKAAHQPRLVSLETFRVLADWQHFAILALTNTRDFVSDAAWIARRLRIKPIEARFALDRLLQLGLLRRTPKGVEAVNEAQVTTSDDIASSAIQENHRQQLARAEQALKEQAVAFREFNNITLSMNLRDLPEAKRRIRDFVNQFNREMEKKHGQEIFQLNVQLFLASHRDKGEA